MVAYHDLSQYLLVSQMSYSLQKFTRMASQAIVQYKLGAYEMLFLRIMGGVNFPADSLVCFKIW